MGFDPIALFRKLLEVNTTGHCANCVQLGLQHLK